MILRFLFAVLMCCAAAAAQADSIWDSMGVPSAVGGDGPPANILAPDAKQGFAGTVALGYIGTSGNTDTSSLDARFNISYTSGRWFHDLSAETQHTSQNGNTTVSRFDSSGQSNYLFSAHDYVFGHLSYDHNQFGGFEQRTSEAVGYGRRLLEGGTQTLDLEVGVGARQDDLSDGTQQNSGILRFGGKYVWQFSKNGSFGQALAIEKGTDNTYTESITSLQANLISSFAVVLSYTVKHNTSVPVGNVRTDTYTTVSLQYSFN